MFIIVPSLVSAYSWHDPADSSYWNTGISSSSDAVIVNGWTYAGLSWVITERTEGNKKIYNYNYTFTREGGGGLSNIIFEVTNPSYVSEFFNLTSPYTLALSTFSSSGNQDLPRNIYGIKLEGFGDAFTYTFAFDTYHSPMWGDFYAKDGGTVAAYNNFNGNYFAVVPNSIPPEGGGNVPVPPSVWLLGSGLIGFWGIRRRFFKK
jgi:hypothetical protein